MRLSIPSTLTMFATRKRKSDIPLSTTPETKRVRNWERMQTGFDAAKLKIQRNHRARKKRALDALHATEGYRTMTSSEKEDANAKVTVELETRRDVDLEAAAEQWKVLNRISDDHMDDHSDDKSDGLSWESPDENEADVSDPEYEVDESIAAQEGVPYELDAEGEIKLSEETTAGLKRIL
jgi:hypothetical protein